MESKGMDKAIKEGLKSNCPLSYNNALQKAAKEFNKQFSVASRELENKNWKGK